MTVDARLAARVRLVAWLAAFAALAWLVADRFDLTTVWIEVIGPDGSPVRLANGWATVDHPFHITRAEELLRSLRSGDILRWFGQHQGGYPAEFYPTGAAWLDIAVWLAAFGQLPMAVAHKVLIALIVLAPAGLYLWWAARDRLSPGVALLAGAGHVAIAGEWWSGGWTEIALWGLVTNVAAQTAMLGTLAGIAGWLATGRRRDLGIAVLAAGLALGTNPRTGLALVAVVVASVVVAALRPWSVDWRILLKRVVVLAALCFAVAAPVLLPLIRYRDLYYFVHYTGYADLAAWWESSGNALWRPIFWLALAGIAVGLARSGRLVTRVVAVTALVYMGATALLVVSGGGFVAQLELTRLMPFQRMLLFYLAAVAVHDAVAVVVGKPSPPTPLPPRERGDGLSPPAPLPPRRERGDGRPVKVGLRFGVGLPGLVTSVGLVLLAGVLVWMVVLRPAGFVPEEQRGLRGVPSSAHAAAADFELAVRAADELAPPGTAILILGSALSWHQVLNAPAWSERRFFYDDWLWYWQRDHAGPYNPATEHAYPIDMATLTADYLRTHGIGAVVVADVPGQENRRIARASPLLALAAQGAYYDVLSVNEPVPIVTAGDRPAGEIAISNHTIRATGVSGGEPILVRHNWYPRWKATVNGEPAEIVKRSDGYMSVAVPSGEYELDLRYTVTRLDWLARALFVAGSAIAIALVTGVGERLRLPRRPATDHAAS